MPRDATATKSTLACVAAAMKLHNRPFLDGRSHDDSKWRYTCTISVTLQLSPLALKPDCLIRALGYEKDYLSGKRPSDLGFLLVLALIT